MGICSLRPYEARGNLTWPLQNNKLWWVLSIRKWVRRFSSAMTAKQTSTCHEQVLAHPTHVNWDPPTSLGPSIVGTSPITKPQRSESFDQAAQLLSYIVEGGRRSPLPPFTFSEFNLGSSGEGGPRYHMGFPYMGVLYPQIIHFIGIFHCKPTILGYRHFRKPPYQSILMVAVSISICRWEIFTQAAEGWQDVPIEAISDAALPFSTREKLLP